ncbi:MAG: serine/threonine-protein kinase [Oscillospiraceae bacterium]|nr:serine/threonine-protein kinase [Oscillospiraceae bacterium]
MEGFLKKGTEFISESGNHYRVVKLLGSGGQGEVYEARCGESSYALKWYFKNNATDAQKAILENLISRGSPDKVFLWPAEMVFDARFSNTGDFGYIMPLRPENFKGIVDLMKCRVSPTFTTLARTAFNLTRGYEKLHSMGLAYNDISFGNLFFNPENGDVLICDNDNVSAGEKVSVNGTPRFMAPEIVRGEANPSRNTDLFSLAILLFYLFMVHHPLEGALEAKIKALDIYAMERLYGKRAVFIFDPDNESNRPVKGYHDNALIYWDLFPKQIKDLFIESFTIGINQPSRRVTERRWLDAIVNLLFGVIICTCGSEVFCDDESAVKGITVTCWNCRKAIPPVLKIVNEKSRVLLMKDTKLYEHHMTGNFNLETVIGSVTQNPNNPNQWGIRNESGCGWVYISADGSRTPVAVGKSALIAKGARIDFGSQVGEIQ